MIVGKVHILDEIAELARRQHPYGKPGEPKPVGEPIRLGAKGGRVVDRFSRVAGAAEKLAELREIKKEGLSEYFLYTIEGSDTGGMVGVLKSGYGGVACRGRGSYIAYCVFGGGGYSR